jgi:hypothetical protein
MPDIPQEGLKLVAIVGYVNQTPVWREVGILKTTKRGGMCVYLQRCFNPAAVCDGDPQSLYANLHAKAFSQEELERKQGKQQNPSKYPKSNSNFHDMEDDIPF